MWYSVASELLLNWVVASHILTHIWLCCLSGGTVPTLSSFYSTHFTSDLRLLWKTSVESASVCKLNYRLDKKQFSAVAWSMVNCWHPWCAQMWSRRLKRSVCKCDQNDALHTTHSVLPGSKQPLLLPLQLKRHRLCLKSRAESTQTDVPEGYFWADVLFSVCQPPPVAKQCFVIVLESEWID